MFALRPRGRNKFNISLSNGSDYKYYRALEVPFTATFSYFAVQICMTGSIVRYHLGHMAEGEINTTTLDTFLRTIRLIVDKREVTSNMTHVSGNDGAHIRASQCIGNQWFASIIFRVLRQLHRNPVLVVLAIAQIADVNLDAIGVEWFCSSMSCQSSLFPLVPEMTRKTCRRIRKYQGWSCRDPSGLPRVV